MIEGHIETNRQPKKRLAVFIDGTWNVEDNNTNVWRMYSLCSRFGTDQVEQVCYYTRGVGTAYGEKVRGGWFGYGIKETIKDAYEWLIAHYNEGDDLFVFGFSRGAYAARSLAGLIALCGIVRSGSPIGVGELFDRAQNGEASRTLYKLLDLKREGKLKETQLLERWMIKYSTPADITMVGVWDTVGALRGQKGYLETGLRTPLKNAFHALAIDEHRKKFAPTLYTINHYLDRPPNARPNRLLSNVEQRWFVGAHANLGGGYNSDLLPQPPLWWLMQKASALKLTFRETLEQDDLLYTAVVRDSFKEFAHGAYRVAMLFKPFYRPIGADPVTVGNVKTFNVNETIDASVFERWRRDDNYRPENLRDWAGRRKLDPANLKTSVSATDPTASVPD